MAHPCAPLGSFGHRSKFNETWSTNTVVAGWFCPLRLVLPRWSDHQSSVIQTSNKTFQGHYSCSTHHLRPFACHFLWKMGGSVARDSASARYLILNRIYNLHQQQKNKHPYKLYKTHSKCIFLKNSTPPILFTKDLQLIQNQKKNIQNVSPPGGVDFPNSIQFQLTVQRPTELDTVCFETVPPTWRLFDHHKGLEHLSWKA